MNMIFHHPFPVVAKGRSGSSVRPYKMLEAFRANGYKVEEITGYAAQRRVAIERLREQVAGGRRFDFAYSETHTLPTALTEPHHLPVNPLLDYKLFRMLKTWQVPIGLFYRDIHWRFGRSLSFESPAKRVVTAMFHRLEWRSFVANVDYLFLPSLAMSHALLSTWPVERMSALPPGGDLAAPNALFLSPINSSGTEGDSGTNTSMGRTGIKGLRLLYVGGVKPPLYDLSPLFVAVARANGTSLTICCRQEEWEAVRDSYRLPENLRVVHRSGGDLAELYVETDAIAMLWEGHPYMEFAMPVKLMEAISFGRPVITLSGTESARFVQREGVGWVIDSAEAAAELLSRLATDPKHLTEVTNRVREARSQHTWRARADQVARTLSLGSI